MVIYPDITTTPDAPTIKFYQPRDQIDLSKELPRILHAQGWGCGTLFNVMFMNHEKTKLLACGRFVVTEEIETIQTNDANQYQPMTKTVFSRTAEQIGDWWPDAYKAYLTTGEVTTEVTGAGDAVSSALYGSGGGLPTNINLNHMEQPRRRGRPPKAA